jgi:hypothetical protein
VLGRNAAADVGCGRLRDLGIHTRMLDLDQDRITIRSSIPGPVPYNAGGRIVALRVAGLERAGIGEEWWKMGRARNEPFRLST